LSLEVGADHALSSFDWRLAPLFLLVGILLHILDGLADHLRLLVLGHLGLDEAIASAGRQVPLVGFLLDGLAQDRESLLHGHLAVKVVPDSGLVGRYFSCWIGHVIFILVKKYPSNPNKLS